jgi:transcriptional regulator with XRE-family HTH domain
MYNRCMGERTTTWGRNIKAARRAAKLTQVGLADVVQVTQPTIARWEEGSVVIPDAMRFAVADALRVDPSLLFPMIRERAS